MLPSSSGILTKAIKQCIQLSTTNTSISLASLLKCTNFRSSRLELFCKRGLLRNFAKFTGVSSGTGVSCEFCDILKNAFVRRTPQVAASGICTNQDFLFSYCMWSKRLHFHMYFPQNNHFFISI